MQFKPELMKQLREMTQAGMIDCKKALEANDNDLEKASQWLREKGIVKAAKKADAIASEGSTAVLVKADHAVILELNSQTDFVANSEAFIALLDEITVAILESKTLSQENIDTLKLTSGKTIAEACIDLTAKLGEKIHLRRFETVNKKPGEMFSHYKHTNGRISTLIVLENPTSEEVAKNVAMHAAAMGPKFVNSSKVDQKWLENEKTVLIEQTVAEGKPKEFAEKIVKGRINKLLADVCLDDQPYVRDPSVTVSQYLINNKTKAISLIRFEVGEGIEKKEVNFAKEVAEQMK